MAHSNSTLYQFRLDAEEKQQAFAVFAELGIKPAQAMRLFLRQVTATHSIPFDICIPNATTLEAMTEAEQLMAEKQARFQHVDELFRALEKNQDR